MNEQHLSEAMLIDLVRRGASHPHLNDCAFCREQYDAIVEMNSLQSESHSEPARTNDTQFRLAAQSIEKLQTEMTLRQTWYLEDGTVLIRVFEDGRKNQLVGFCVCEPSRLPGLRIRFSGIETDFSPAVDGSFSIGSPELPVEPMTITLLDS